jgi:hypothetical protein
LFKPLRLYIQLVVTPIRYNFLDVIY